MTEDCDAAVSHSPGCIVFVRHCQSLDNAAKVFSNRPPGAGLSDLGRLQAAIVAEQLKDLGLEAVYTSTAARAIKTATAIRDAAKALMTINQALLEYDFGIYEGSSDPAVGSLSRDVLKSWIVEGNLSSKLAGGESGFEVVERFLSFIVGLAVNGEGAPVVAVSHVGTLTIGLLRLCANLEPSDVWGTALPHGVPIIVEQVGKDWICTSWPA